MCTAICHIFIIFLLTASMLIELKGATVPPWLGPTFALSHFTHCIWSGYM